MDGSSLPPSKPPPELPEIPSRFEGRRMMSGRLVGALLLAGASLVLLVVGPGVLKSVAGWALIVLGTSWLALWIHHALRRPVLIMEERGIEDLRTKRGLIPWREVKQVRMAEGEPRLEIETHTSHADLPAGEPLLVDLQDLSSRRIDTWTYLHEHQPDKIPPSSAAGGDPRLEVWTFGTEAVGDKQGWELVEWCLAHGGTEFSIHEVERTRTLRAQAFFDRLRPHALPPAQRPFLTRGYNASVVQLWRLDEETVRILREYFAHGILSNDRDNDFWMEDFTVYRDGHVLMAVVTHEWEAYVNVLPTEFEQLKPMLYRPIRAPWLHA
ncbi:MAG TPA: hypothetical protein VFP10_10870 [Candidatus Eisenbacteria bacterium]|nr:hypothetical protein [Candidatus Eisenbacteria bacterium]